MPSRPRAFSYIRFSSPQQAKGNSFQRQFQKTKDYCVQHDLDLDETTFFDEGVSAFRGKNLLEGQFGLVIQKIESGEIPKGSYLIVESLDRISRQDVYEQMTIFLRIIKLGIKIVTLMDNMVHSQTNSPEGQLSLLMALSTMTRANEESETKSKRIRSAWDNKRTNGRNKLLTNLVPAWLKVNEGTVEIDENRVKIIKEIFDDCIMGIGRKTIARKLNSRQEPVWGSTKRNKSGTWGPSYISKILSNRAVLGEFRPHFKREGRRYETGEVWENYYPKIISEDIFHLAQSRIGLRQGKGGRGTSKANNLFSTIARCANCGDKMTFLRKSDTDTYLRCRRSDIKHTACNAKAVNYRLAEAFMIRTLTGEQWSSVLEPSGDELSLKDELESKIEESARMQTQIDRTNEILVLSESPLVSTIRRLEGMEKQKIQLDKQAEELRGRIASHKSSEEYDGISILADFYRLGDDRLQFRLQLKRLFETYFKAIYVAQPAPGEAGVFAIAKGSDKFIVGRESVEKPASVLYLSPWQLSASHRRRTIQFRPEETNAGILRPSPYNHTLDKGVDPIADLLTVDASAYLRSAGIFNIPSEGFSKLNNEVTARLRTLKDDFAAYKPFLQISQGETIKDGIFGRSTELRDLNAPRERVVRNFESERRN